jgi:hypothetical protein
MQGNDREQGGKWTEQWRRERRVPVDAADGMASRHGDGGSDVEAG